MTDDQKEIARLRAELEDVRRWVRAEIEDARRLTAAHLHVEADAARRAAQAEATRDAAQAVATRQQERARAAEARAHAWRGLALEAAEMVEEAILSGYTRADDVSASAWIDAVREKAKEI